MCGYCYSMAPKHLNSMCDYTSGPAALAMPACPSPTIIVITVITTTTNVQPEIAGKPYPFMMEMALARMGTSRETTFVVGDRLETDIAGGQNAGCPTALVLSGVSTRAQGQAWLPKIDIIAENLSELVGA